jgi:hypothetical protein
MHKRTTSFGGQNRLHVHHLLAAKQLDRRHGWVLLVNTNQWGVLKPKQTAGRRAKTCDSDDDFSPFMFVRHRSLFASLTPFFIAFPCMEPAEKLPPSEAVAGQSQAPPRRHADTAPGDVDVEPSSAEAAPATSAASAPPQRLDLAALRNQALTESQATQLFDEFASAPDARAAGWTKNGW